MSMRHDTYEAMHDKLKNIMLGEPHISEAAAKEKLWEELQHDPQRYFRLLYGRLRVQARNRSLVNLSPLSAPRPGKSLNWRRSGR